jgi:hypothetical protein
MGLTAVIDDHRVRVVRWKLQPRNVRRLARLVESEVDLQYERVNRLRVATFGLCVKGKPFTRSRHGGQDPRRSDCRRLDSSGEKIDRDARRASAPRALEKVLDDVVVIDVVHQAQE